MQTHEFSDTLTSELYRNKTRCEQIDEAHKALQLERRALQARNEALEAVGAMFQSSNQVVQKARRTQARLNPAKLYQSSQQVVDEAIATRTRLTADSDNAVFD